MVVEYSRTRDVLFTFSSFSSKNEKDCIKRKEINKEKGERKKKTKMRSFAYMLMPMVYGVKGKA